MRSLLIALLLVFFTVQTLSSPHILSLLQRRNDLSSPGPVTINTTILSQNGTDLTPSFHTRVYYQPKIVAPDLNLTGRDILSSRGTLSVLGRPVVDCRSPTATFQHSHCKHRNGIHGSMQEYLVYCQESDTVQPSSTSQGRRYTPRPRPQTANRGGPAGTSYQPHDPPFLAEEGSCLPHEICVDGIFENRGWPVIASCMKMDDFTEDDNNSREDGQIEWLTGRSARVVITAPDGATPLTMSGMEVDSGRRSGGNVRKKTCTNCFELKTGMFEEGTNSLKLEASVVNTAAAAAAVGIAWVAVFSG